MMRALRLAAGRSTHPNPRVGAVVVDDGEVVGEGAHDGPGTAHAEVVALAMAGDRARGADLYVTLEPCSHHGHTPPCVDAVLAAGISRVVVGVEDPDERVRGRGAAALTAGGVEVVMSDDPGSAESIDPGYFHHRRSGGLPRVVAKYAMTLDGSAAAADGSSRWITSKEAREDAHLLRAESDAVVVGAGTVRRDDPSLDVRLDGFSGNQPRPVVIAGSDALPSRARIWDRNPIVVAPVDIDVPNGEVIVVDALVVDGRTVPNPQLVARSLADRGLFDLLLEGGPGLLGSWWRAGLITLGYVYVGGKVGGGTGVQPIAGAFDAISKARDVQVFDVQRLGPDVRIGFH